MLIDAVFNELKFQLNPALHGSLCNVQIQDDVWIYEVDTEVNLSARLTGLEKSLTPEIPWVLEGDVSARSTSSPEGIDNFEMTVVLPGGKPFIPNEAQQEILLGTAVGSTVNYEKHLYTVASRLVTSYVRDNVEKERAWLITFE